MTSKNFSLTIYAFVAFAASLLVYRIAKTDTVSYIFLAWNLFLAFIPFWISSFLKRREKLSYFHLPLFFLWFLFLPNSPYILTDLFHLKQRAGIPLWFDLILISSFAIIGLILLYKSLIDILFIAKRILHPSYIKYILPMLFWLIAFGLYLGRYLRFNSWDLASHPFRLMRSGFHSLFYKETIGFTIIFATFMWLLYLTLLNFNKEENRET